MAGGTGVLKNIDGKEFHSCWFAEPQLGTELKDWLAGS
jgi:hypothetical protein